MLDRLSITEPLIGFYDAPDPAPFEPLITPGGRQCIFASVKKWRQGKTLHLTREKHGCGGGHLFGVETMAARGDGGVPLRRGGPAGHPRAHEPVARLGQELPAGPRPSALRPPARRPVRLPAHRDLLRERRPAGRALHGRHLLQPPGRPPAGAGPLRLGLHAAHPPCSTTSRRPRPSSGRPTTPCGSSWSRGCWPSP